MAVLQTLSLGPVIDTEHADTLAAAAAVEPTNIATRFVEPGGASTVASHAAKALRLFRLGSVRKKSPNGR